MPIKRPAIERMSDDELLDLKISSLKLTIKGSPIEEAVTQLYRELRLKKLQFRPHIWLSSEWFTPDGVPGIAVPFYLVHPRLRALEQAQMLEVEGGTPHWCMRIFRHECGHAIDNGYRLHRRAEYRRLFGSWSKPYPTRYKPKPYSKKFVVHLDMWYAQSHPAEDFAETFAVWLDPRSHWRQAYAGWPALKKLEYVDRLMQEIRDEPLAVKTRRVSSPLRKTNETLREHYAQRHAFYGGEHPYYYERDLRRIFSNDPSHWGARRAVDFIEDVRPQVRMMVSRWTGQSQVLIDRTLDDIARRTGELDMRMVKPDSEAMTDLMLMVAVQTMNHLNDGRHRVAL